MRSLVGFEKVSLMFLCLMAPDERGLEISLEINDNEQRESGKQASADHNGQKCRVRNGDAGN
jgi:hypothetical protein